MKIPSTKLNPRDILPIMEIIQKNEGNIEAIKEKVHSYLSNISEKGKITQRNAVYALAFPTLKRLNLLIGKGDRIRLSVDGGMLFRIYETEGIDAFSRKLAYIIFRADKESADVLGAIEDSRKEHLSKREIALRLVEKGIETSVADDRLTKWLRILKYVRFIDKVDSLYMFNNYQLSAVKRESVKIPLNVFFNKLLQAHRKLTRERRGNPYIPIPAIERQVCSQFADKGLTTFDFRRHLSELRGKTINGYTVVFSKPGFRESKGLRIKGEYYYYIAIFSR